MSDPTVRFNKALDQCIADITERGKTIEECLNPFPELRQELEPILRLTIRLRSLNSASASPEFHRAAVTRMNLLIQANSRQRPATQPDFLAEWKKLFNRFGHRLQLSISPAIAVIVMLVIMLSAGTGVVYASSNSLPGDNLYGMKSWIENARLDLSGPGYGQARMYLNFAKERMEEAKELAALHRTGPMNAAMGWYQEQMRSAVSYLDADTLTPQQKVVLATELVKTLPSEKYTVDQMLTLTPEEMAAIMLEAQNMMYDAHKQAAAVLTQYKDIVDLPGGVPEMPTTLSSVVMTHTPEPTDPEEETGWPTFDETAMWTETVWIMDTPWPTGCPTEWWPTGWPDEWKYCSPTEWPTGIPTNFPTEWPTYWQTEWATYLPPEWKTLIPTIQYLPSLEPTIKYLPSLVPTLRNLPSVIPTLQYLITQLPHIHVTIPASWPTMAPPPSSNPEPPPGLPHPPPGWPSFP